MSISNECHVFHHIFTCDDLSKKSQCKKLKFQRAFQFLQLLLLQRVYGIDVITRSSLQRRSKRQLCQFEVFLGGSCNPTTWRYEQAIPYFQARSISYYNPQVPNWTPDLVEIEHRAKELAPLLFFVIDYSTRSLAAIAEVCYLAARRRNIITVLNPMPEDKNQIKFIQQKKNSNEIDDEHDYKNVCEARRILRKLLRSINVPVFDNVKVALECATFILEATKQTVIHSNVLNEDESEKVRRTIYESPEDFYRQMNQSEMTSASPILSDRQHSTTVNHSSPCLSPCFHSTHFTTGVHFRRSSITTKTQLSCLTNESGDDDGYGSLISSDRTLSQSSSSIFSDVCDYSTDENISSRFYLPISILNNIITIFSFTTTPSITSNACLIQSFFTLYQKIKTTFFPSKTHRVPISSSSSSSEDETFLFDLYIASGNHDEYWLNTFALPVLNEINIKYIKRQTYHDNDQLDILYDNYIRKRSHLLYYIINDYERLSHLTTELAFLIGERKYHIIVCLQLTINENSEKILTKNERQDIERSRKYLEDIAKKEKIVLCRSREQSWQHVLAFLQRN
ncbi:unnamed protein product [Adineta steineri]|uniref:Uncharacterized protein n=1 Tax=Adineta steineri TaxID=433720 RepID=A0A818RKV2_9BILA|nr:unnamed protein product [Adineta steineri]CAF3658870.1 unnamed protein product [Adineta steineri]